MARHYLEQELHELLRTDPAILEFLERGSLDGLWYWDLTDTEHEWMSPRFWTALGWDPAEREHLASEWQDLIHPEDLKKALANFEAHKADPSVPYDLDVRYLDPQDRWRWVRCRGLILRDERGNAIRMLGAHNDITRLKRVEARLRERTRQLEDANAELRSASHDLQAPLRRIRMFAQLLEEDLGPTLSEQSRGDLDSLITATEQMHSVISAVLRLAEAGGSDFAAEPVALGPLTDEVVAEFRGQLQAIAGEVEVGDLPTVTGDPLWLRRVLQNLLDNCVKYRHPDRPLKVTITFDAGSRTLWVADNGIGVAKDSLEDIFLPFRRLHPGVEGTTGHGLGLALCRRVARRLGGEMRAESDGLSGTRLGFTLPAA